MLTSALLPERDEMRDADAGTVRLLEQRHAEWARLARERHPARDEGDGAKDACIETSGTVLITPMLAGPSTRMP